MIIKYVPHKNILEQPEFDRVRWAEALESGSYKQCCSLLHDEETNSFCCLGVWELINGRELTEFNYDGDGNVSSVEIPSLYSNPAEMGGVLPENIYVANSYYKYGSDGESVDWRAGRLDILAYELNDKERLSFIQIAQLLRGNEVIIGE